jgi:signal transduction histidine kinase
MREKIKALYADAAISFGFIFASTAKMDSLLAGLLKISRLGRAPVSSREVDMNQLLRNVLGTLEFRIKESGVTMNIDPLPPCSGDVGLLDQVFSNLLDNALKYLDPRKPVNITVEGRIEGANAIYTVADNGIGIAPAFQSQIFEIFRRLDVSKPGDGIGLTICSKILDRLDGRIWLHSAPGTGSSFYVSLPRS